MRKNVRQLGAVVTRADDRVIQVIASTSTPDRSGDAISADGWDLDAYRRNPVVLLQHDGEPIGRATTVAVVGDQLLMTIQLLPEGVSEKADFVWRLIQEGAMNAVSVGFRPIAERYNSERGGVDYLEQELLEISIVSVPCNPEALIVSRSLRRALQPRRALADVMGQYLGTADTVRIWLEDPPRMHAVCRLRAPLLRCRACRAISSAPHEGPFHCAGPLKLHDCPLLASADPRTCPKAGCPTRGRHSDEPGDDVGGLPPHQGSPDHTLLAVDPDAVRAAVRDVLPAALAEAGRRLRTARGQLE